VCLSPHPTACAVVQTHPPKLNILMYCEHISDYFVSPRVQICLYNTSYFYQSQEVFRKLQSLLIFLSHKCTVTYVPTWSNDVAVHGWRQSILVASIKQLGLNCNARMLHNHTCLLAPPLYRGMETKCCTRFIEFEWFLYRPVGSIFYCGTATGEGSVGSGDPSAQSAEKFFHLHFSDVWIGSHSTFVLCCALPRPYLAVGQGGQLPPQRNWLQSINFVHSS